jgi:hypothetical protein
LLVSAIALVHAAHETPPASTMPPAYHAPPSFGPAPMAQPPVGQANGVDVMVSGPDESLAEVLIDVNPTNPNNLVICGHSNTLQHMATYYSFDKGQTWTLVPVGDAQDDLGLTTRFDPAVTFDANGNVFVAYGVLLFVGSTERTSLVVTKSTDGGQTYGPAFIIGTANRVLNVPGHDKWVLATGPDPTVPGQENVYIAWTWNIPTPAGNVDQQISISRSIDGGLTFSPPLVLNDDSIAGRDRALVADPSVGPNGEVYVSWNDIDATDATLFVDRSFDGGLTWGTDVVVSTGAMAWRTPIPAQPDRGVGAAPVMDVDISGGAFNGRAYTVYCQPGANGLDILLRYSDDQAQTWSLPVRVNDDATARDQFLPWIDVGRNNGLVSVVFYDAREDPLNQSVRVYAAMSRTGGITFEPNEPVADVPSNQSVANPYRYGGNYLEYIGVATGDDAVHIVWTDARFLWPVLIDYSLRYYYEGIPLEAPPVPVLFSAFDAVATDEGVAVSWELWSDEAMDEFVLYRREDASPIVAVTRGAVDGVSGSYLDASVDPGQTYQYEMLVRSTDGDEFRSRVASVTTPAVALTLGQNHPNPFNPRTTIPYRVPAAAHPQRVRLVVLDVSGRVVRTLVDEDQPGGAYHVSWEGKDERGAHVSSGVYFYVLDVGEKRQSRKMVLLK